MWTVRSSRVVLPDGERPASIQIEGGVITSVADVAQPLGAASDALRIARPELVEGPTRSGQAPEGLLIDVGDLVISPGIVDTHVHINEPGRTEWEGFDTATRAAAAGGVTTIVDMPLNCIPATTTVAALEAKRAAAQGRCHVDVGFWGGVIPGNDGDLDALVDEGVRGFKCFLVPSGVDEFPAVAERDLRRALPILARRGVPLLVHAELPECLREPAHPPSLGGAASEQRRASPSYATYLATRPAAAEAAAIRLMVR